MRRARWLGPTLFLVAVGTAACGGSTKAGGSGGGSPTIPVSTPPTTLLPSPSGTPVVIGGSGPCALVTQDEAANVVGAPVPPSSERSFLLPLNGVGSIKERVCTFGSEVLVAELDLGSGAPVLFAQYRSSLSSESDFKTVSGLGDEAFFAKGQLAVRKGGTGLIVDVGQNTGTTSNEAAKEQALATIALGRI